MSSDQALALSVLSTSSAVTHVGQRTQGAQSDQSDVLLLLVRLHLLVLLRQHLLLLQKLLLRMVTLFGSRRTALPARSIRRLLLLLELLLLLLLL